MVRRLTFVAVALCAAIVGDFFPQSASVSRAFAADDAQRPWLVLPDGVKVRFVTATERVPEGGAPASRELFAIFEFENRAVLKDHAKLISAADLVFGQVVLLPADTRGFKFAAVNFVVSESSGANAQILEDFHYARRDDAVWLRQAGSEAWKVAQDPAFAPPAIETVDLGEQGVVEVSVFGEIEAPKGSTRALAVEMRSDTPLANHDKKYQEVRAFWNRLDREKLKADGFDFVDIQHFTDRQRGVFQVRDHARLRIKRPEGQDWPALPETPPQSGKAPLVAWAVPPTARTEPKLASSKDDVGAPQTVSLDVDGQDLSVGVGISVRAAAVRGQVLPVASYLKHTK